MPLVSTQLGDNEYIGYSLHYSCSEDFNTVATHLEEKASAVGSKFHFSVFPRAHENFIFLRAEEKTTKVAVQCLLRKDELIGRFSPKVCFHKDETTVVDGLTETMQAATSRTDCYYYFPARPGDELAVREEVEPSREAAGAAIGALVAEVD